MATTGVQFVDNLILGFNRISNEKKETFLKLLILSVAAILCESYVIMCIHVFYQLYSLFHKIICCVEI